ncbi:MAG: alpha-L-rhamnosidase N-terminal domain-containing protein [Clostridiales bacterium]|jgi:hypothetical protein|nr:alpha-L-rhamnosidase N-terminal domain-containing protein [Clostridiales bacterium]
MLFDSEWIWTGIREADDGSSKQVLFRKSLFLDEVPETAVIKASADTRYRLYVNGTSVAFGPCKGDAQIWHYEEVEIAHLLQKGENVIAAVVLRMSPSRLANHSIWRTNTPGLYVDGYLKTDSSWKWKVNSSIKFVPEDSMMTYLDIFEIAKGDSSIKGWKSVGFDDSSWSSAKPYGIHEIRKSVSPGNLIPRPIPQMFEVQRTFKDIVAIRSSSLPESEWSELLQGTSVTLNPGSVHDVEIDAGELTTGFLQLAVSGGEGAEIKILTSECYSYEPDTTLMFPVPLKGDRTDSKNGALRGYTDTYLAEGFGASDEPETYETFWFRAFRYVKMKIDVKEQPLQILRFDYRETGYPLDQG